MPAPARPSLTEQLWGAAGVLIGLTVFIALVAAFPRIFGGDKDWGFLVVMVVGGSLMHYGGRLMQWLYRIKRQRPGS